MISKQPINHERIRKISGSFSWIDHRIIRDGYLKAMNRNEIVLYFFLILVGDKNGVSFYSYDKICGLLKIELDEFIHARTMLMNRSLIDFDNGRFQVLELPKTKNNITIQYPRTNDIHSLKQLLNKLTQ